MARPYCDRVQAERSPGGATARIGVATAALYPTISFGLGAGSTGILGDLGEAATNRWSLGSVINWTLPGGGERARIRQADAGADAALARFDGVVLNALREVESSLTIYGRDLDRNAALHEARAQAAEAQGQAQRTLAGADAALAESNAKGSRRRVALFLALGGGWEIAPR